MWCKWEQPESSEDHHDSEDNHDLENALHTFVSNKIQEVKQRVEDILGIPTRDIGRLGISVRNQLAPQDGGHVPASGELASLGGLRGRTQGTLALALAQRRHGEGGVPGVRRLAREEYLSLEVTVHDGQDIFVDVGRLNEEDQERFMHLSPSSEIVFTEVRDIDESELETGRRPVSTAGMISGLDQSSSHAMDKDFQQMMQMTQM